MGSGRACEESSEPLSPAPNASRARASAFINFSPTPKNTAPLKGRSTAKPTGGVGTISLVGAKLEIRLPHRLLRSHRPFKGAVFSWVALSSRDELDKW